MKTICKFRRFLHTCLVFMWGRSCVRVKSFAPLILGKPATTYFGLIQCSCCNDQDTTKCRAAFIGVADEENSIWMQSQPLDKASRKKSPTLHIYEGRGAKSEACTIWISWEPHCSVIRSVCAIKCRVRHRIKNIFSKDLKDDKWYEW